MINNRQGGRRRGRGGQRPQNLGGRPDGNRQDNRQRGNAAQLLEKYKSMARDAQLGGDRVQTEYYLQYADHYYRVLGESRARFEEQRRARGDGGDDSDEDEGDDDQMEAGDEQRSPGGRDDGRDDQRPDRNERFERTERAERSERPERSDRRPRYVRNQGNGDDAAERPQANESQSRSPGDGNLESIAFDALPPAIGRVDTAEQASSDEEAARPKRRARKPRAADGDGEVAPAA